MVPRRSWTPSVVVTGSDDDDRWSSDWATLSLVQRVERGGENEITEARRHRSSAEVAGNDPRPRLRDGRAVNVDLRRGMRSGNKGSQPSFFFLCVGGGQRSSLSTYMASDLAVWEREKGEGFDVRVDLQWLRREEKSGEEKGRRIEDIRVLSLLLKSRVSRGLF